MNKKASPDIRDRVCPRPGCGCVRCGSGYASTTLAPGAFFFTEATPASAAFFVS